MAMIINQYTLQTVDIDKEFGIREGSIFLGVELIQHEIIVWVAEPEGTESPIHTAYLTCIPEHGSYGDDWVHVGLCANRVFAEDETFHVIAYCEDMDIRTTAQDADVLQSIQIMQVHLKTLEQELAVRDKKIEAIGKKVRTLAKAKETP